MKYFVNYEEWKALGGTNYFEFQEGRFKNKFWLENSICIHMDVFDQLLLDDLFYFSLGAFDYFGETDINKEQWQKIVEKSKENELWQIAVEEMIPWVEKCFIRHKYFSIVGV